MRKTILYIGDFKFGISNAESQLVLGNANILNDIGYNTVFIGNEQYGEMDINILKNKREFFGYTVYDLRFDRSIKNIIDCKRIHLSILEIAKLYNVCSVFCYGTPTFAIELKLLKDWCTKNKIPFVINCVDIPMLSHGSILQRILKTIDRRYRYKLFREADGLISVSRYIEDFFKTSRIKASIIIPPVKDTRIYPVPYEVEDGPIKLVYGGCPFPIDGRKVSVDSYKDRLDIAIDYVEKAYNHGVSVTLDIYGITFEQYSNVVERHKQLKDSRCIRFHGRVSYLECAAAFRSAHFLILLRTDSIMSKAGVSTKIVDAICNGTPVITAPIGDIKEYLIENEHGYYVDINDKGYEKFLYAITQNKEKINYLKRNAYYSKVFDYHNYCTKMSNFMNELL